MATKTTTATASITPTRERLLRALKTLVLLVPGVCLICFGYIHFADGMALDRAIPVPVAMVAQIPLSPSSYSKAAKALGEASPRDGYASLVHAEALFHTGRPQADIAVLLEQGLRRQPASARGWILLTEALQSADQKRAAAALSQALVLAPRDYWIAAARVRAAGSLWPLLDEDTQAAAKAQARLLWQEPVMQPQIVVAAETDAGARVLTLSFDENEIRDINRFLAHARRKEK